MHLELFKEEVALRDKVLKDTRIRLRYNFICIAIFASTVDEDVFTGLQVRSNHFNCMCPKKVYLQTTFQRPKIKALSCSRRASGCLVRSAMGHRVLLTAG